MIDIIGYVVIASLLTWGSNALGAATIFLFKSINQKVIDAMLGFAAGVMIAASIFSLILPSLEFAEQFNPGIHPIIIVVIGFILGAAFIFLLDIFTPHIHLFEEKSEGPKTSLKRSMLLFLAVTIHNIPEGLAVGIALGAVNIATNFEQAELLLASAMALAVGISIQNFPEGACVTLPLHCDGMSKKKAFMFGQASSIVEPIAIVLGVILIQLMQPILPIALSFAAGAMFYVVIEELIPESQKHSNTNLATIFTLFGFLVMMVLDIMLG